MKIEIESLDDLRDLIGVMDPEFLRTWQPALGKSTLSANIERELAYDMRVRHDEVVGHVPTSYDEPEGLPTDIPAPLAASMAAAVAETGAALREEASQLDADGVPHNTEWHSEPAKINADGRWRARRKRDEDAYKAWLLEQAVEVAEAAVAADAEPVATETHALPQDELQHSTDPEMDRALNADAAYLNAMGADAGPTLSDLEVAPTVDLSALVEASQEAALDASDSHMDLIKACQGFISDHGHPAYNALKAAVAPLEGAENGKAVPQFTPAERRLMRACIDNYPKP